MSEQVEPLVLPTTDGGTVRASVVNIAKADEHGNQLQLAEGGVRDIFAHETGALEPPYSPTSLQHWFEHSNALRQNVDAMITNIDGFGHTYEALVNLDADDTHERVAAFIRLERQTSTDEVQVADPTAAEIAERMKELRNGQVIEKLRLEHFFKYAAENGFVKLRKITRQDIETTGNGYWEVVRDQGGNLRRFNHLPCQTMRLLPLDKQPTRYKMKRHTLVNTLEVVEEDKRFRRFIQQVGQSRVFFKEYGDPRTVSSTTGKYFQDVEELKRAEPTSRAATEVVHFRIHTSRSGYGVPRWIGNILSVLGSRECEEVNYGYFQNKSVPPLAVIVSNGRLGADSRTELQNYIRNHIRGKENFHSVLIIEAQSAEGSAFENSGQAQVKLQPLTEAQMNDALFESYDERNIDKVGMSFRLPRMLRGDTRDFNRSCYSADTETLTNNGWKLWHEVGDTDQVAAVNKDTGEVVFVVPEHKLVYDVADEELVRFKNAHVDCFVTQDHRMLVRSAQTRASDPPWQVFKAAEIPYARFEFKQAAALWASSEELDTFHLPKADGCRIERGHSHAGSVRGDDWLEFLGYWLSEGGLVCTDHPSAPYLVYIDQKKPAIREKMRACLDRLGWKYSTQEKPCGTTHFLLSNRCLRAWLVETCGVDSKTRRIPSEYLRLSSRQLRVLFDAMMLVDGAVDNRVGRTAKAYYTTSPELAGQAQQILLLLGYRNTMRWSKGANCYRVCFSEHATTRLSAGAQDETPASVSRELYTGKVYCFSVPGYGFFVTRRNGKIALQGNTAQAALDMAERQVFEPERTEFDEWTNRNVLPELGAVHWQVHSRGPIQRDPESLSKMIHDSQDFMTPNMLIELSEQVFNRPFSRIDEDWANQPLKVTLAKMNIEAKVASAGSGVGDGLQDDSGEAEDANPDNNKSQAEPESSHTEESDNKDRQPRAPDGKFGSGKKPADTSVRGANRRARRARTKKSLSEAVDNLVQLRDELHDELVEQATARSTDRRS